MNDVIAVIRLINEAQSQCIWIGPPQAGTKYISVTKYEEFVELLKNTVTANGCRFIDSNNKTDRRTITDSMGLHYNCRESEAWAAKILVEI